MEDKRQEDLDMLTVIGSIKKVILTAYKSLLWLLNFTFRKFIQLLIFVVIGISIGLSLYSLEKAYYKSQLLVTHIRFDNDYCRELVTSLNACINPKDGNTELGKKLNLSQRYAAEVRCIKYTPLNENHAKHFEDSLNVMLPFKIEVEVYDNEILDSLQKGIFYFLESNEYGTKRKEVDKIALDNTFQRLTNEMNEVDSLKKIVNLGIVPKGTGNGIMLGEPVNPVPVYKRGMDLYEARLALGKKMVLNNSFEIVVGFVKSSKQANLGKLLYIVVGALTAYIIGLLILVRRDSRR